MLGIPYAELLTKHEQYRQKSQEAITKLNNDLEEQGVVTRATARVLRVLEEAYQQLEDEAGALAGKYHVALEVIAKLRVDLDLALDKARKFETTEADLEKLKEDHGYLLDAYDRLFSDYCELLDRFEELDHQFEVVQFINSVVEAGHGRT